MIAPEQIKAHSSAVTDKIEAARTIVEQGGDCEISCKVCPFEYQCDCEWEDEECLKAAQAYIAEGSDA